MEMNLSRRGQQCEKKPEKVIKRKFNFQRAQKFSCPRGEKKLKEMKEMAN